MRRENVSTGSYIIHVLSKSFVGKIPLPPQGVVEIAERFT